MGITINFIEANKSVARNSAYSVVQDERNVLCFIPVSEAGSLGVDGQDIKTAFERVATKPFASNDEYVTLAKEELKAIGKKKTASL